jgi:putative ubiquitin-RnfH superfamily antitoxin RatB of RatAB toxin-antitoxin module
VTTGSSQSQVRVEVVLAMPERQEIIPLDLDSGSTVEDAIEQSAIVEKFPGFELDPGKVGVFGGKVPMDQVLRDGDRVEIYRPLIVDPKEVRRQRALKQAKS